MSEHEIMDEAARGERSPRALNALLAESAEGGDENLANAELADLLRAPRVIGEKLDQHRLSGVCDGDADKMRIVNELVAFIDQPTEERTLMAMGDASMEPTRQFMLNLLGLEPYADLPEGEPVVSALGSVAKKPEAGLLGNVTPHYTIAPSGDESH